MFLFSGSMKTGLLFLFTITAACFAFAPVLRAADKPNDTDEIRRERARQLEERRREEPPVRGALIVPKGKTNNPSSTPQKK